MTTMTPIDVVGLFPEITLRLLELLRSLTSEEWQLPTVSSRRTVKDIASHLLDGSLRRLSMQRDGYYPADGNSQPRVGELLMEFLNRLNDEWEVATRRLSPTVLITLIEWADDGLATLFRSLDPAGPAIFSVAWAGEQKSKNWMDVARDYTEKWHHTQQIFIATKRPSTILTRELAYPCLDIFMRALPYTFRDVQADVGSLIEVVVTDDAGGRWFVERTESGWEQIAKTSRRPTSTVTMNLDTAWRLLTKRRTLEAVQQQFPDINITGDTPLGRHALTMVSVMA
ncbi:maleylpyruvate isomerase N-terminal domain-containing protein [Schlesneria paludicola]|uniref:maleylpyruvate isomerase N-terminal domain-containing protein n=1 Tax=Schlesneria paludicola TaxID=360056 RepID=UPI00029A8A3D|nr:maleylpyruvate isomerase N-terminal domain-containing protein [Schlesneria paludicola]